MKNKKALIMAINEKFDDWALSELWIHYYVSCPYFAGDKRAHCYADPEKVNRENCYACKREWLDSEMDK